MFELMLHEHQQCEESLLNHPNSNPDHLNLLPPEICDHICQLLPSLSLHCLTTISEKLCLTAEKEMNIRLRWLKDKVLVSESSSNILLHNSVSMLCPGLILLYSPTLSNPPIHPSKTTYLQLNKSLFTSTSTETSQALSTSHFFPINILENMTTYPICYHILYLPLSDPATSTILFFIPIDHPNIQKVRTLSNWNICLPHQGGLSSILPPYYSNIHLPPDYQKAQLTLAK